MATYKKINNQAVQVSGGNDVPEYFFDTLAEAQAALANIEDGASIYVKEGSTSDVGEKVEELEDAVDKINTDLSDYDFSQSSMTPTDFHDMIQKILDITFPISSSGTFTMSGSVPTVVNVAGSIRNLRIVGTLDGVATTWKYDSNTPGVCTRQVGGNPVDTYSLPNSSPNTINSVSERSFTMGASSYGSVNCTYYVNE